MDGHVRFVKYQAAFPVDAYLAKRRIGGFGTAY